jgi:hypothetical protein
MGSGLIAMQHKSVFHQKASKSHKVVPLHKLRESEKLQSAVGSSYERMRLRGLKRCDQHFIAPQ